jgi:hypothetical protein
MGREDKPGRVFLWLLVGWCWRSQWGPETWHGIRDRRRPLHCLRDGASPTEHFQSTCRGSVLGKRGGSNACKCALLSRCCTCLLQHGQKARQERQPAGKRGWVRKQRGKCHVCLPSYACARLSPGARILPRWLRGVGPAGGPKTFERAPAQLPSYEITPPAVQYSGATKAALASLFGGPVGEAKDRQSWLLVCPVKLGAVVAFCEAGGFSAGKCPPCALWGWIKGSPHQHPGRPFSEEKTGG